MIEVDEYSRPLKKPEARHRYWHIQKSDRDFFPEAGTIFKLEFNNEIFELNVNHKDDVMTGKLYATHHFREGDKIIVHKKKDNLYSLEAPDTELYPTFE